MATFEDGPEGWAEEAWADDTLRVRAEGAGLSPEALEWLRMVPAGARTAGAVGGLVAAGLAADGVKLLATSLPAALAARWAVSVSRSGGLKPSREGARALAAAERWLDDPTEDHRGPLLAAADAAGFGTPAGCAALAAFCAGESLAPPDLPVVPPDPLLAARAAAGALLLAAAGGSVAEAPGRLRDALKAGFLLARTHRVEGVGDPADFHALEVS